MMSTRQSAPDHPTAYRLALLNGGEEHATHLDAAFRNGAAAPPFELAVFNSVDDLVEHARAQADAGEPLDVVMIGPGQPEPLGTGREIRDADPRVQIVFLVSPARVEPVGRALLFSPLIGDAWTADVTDDVATLRQAIEDAAEATRRRRHLRTALERMNVQLGSTREAPDVAQRRQAASDRYLASLLAHAPDAIVSTDLDGRIVSWNDAAERVFGYTEDDAVGQPVERLFSFERGDPEPEALLDRVRDGETVQQRHVQCRRADGSVIDAEITLALVFDEAGQRLGISMIARDVTERVEQQRELEEATARLEVLVEDLRARTAEAQDAARAKSEFMAVISHELRTPLQAIIGYIALLTGGVTGPVTDEQKEQLARARSSADHLLSLIDQVLDLSRADVGSLELQREPVDVCDAGRRAAEDLRPQGDAAGLTLRVGPCPDERLRSVTADPGRVRQILLNLLSNAVKFTEPGGEVEVSFDVAGATDEPAAVVCVRDTGIGLAPDELEQIFEPFYQARTGLSGRVEGMGLGLPISRRLAEAMGGRLDAESEPDEGSVFTLVLPLEER